jgi:methylphosphotriester-DNA--protein-cysteine methyltransferase
MAEDGFVAAVRRVTDAGRVASEAVEAAVRALEKGRQARLAGRPMSEVVDELINGGGRVVRLGAAEAFRQFEREVQAMRVGVIRAMIDEEGLSVTEASARLGISRQAGSRLYGSGTPPAGPLPQCD